MGCDVVSVYNDEVIGVLGYPQPIMDDLSKRDYAFGQPAIPQSNPPYIIEGYTQSYTEGSMLITHVKKEECLVYVCDRFVIVDGIQSREKVLIMQEDKVQVMDVKGKLCAVGLLGGKVVVWDLEFKEKKVQVGMPYGSTHFSAIALTSKFIFCTDTTQPSNKVYCFDFRTVKLKGQSRLGSYEPTLKGKGWGTNHLVCVGADGLWYSHFNGEELCVTKGMFGVYPKTSMTCLDIINNNYVVSGSVDGYVFLWCQYQCVKVLKIGDVCLSSLCVGGNNLMMVGDFEGNIKCLQFDIKVVENKEEKVTITEQFVSIILDSYQLEHPVQWLCTSEDMQSYYLATRNGHLFDKMIPTTTNLSKMNMSRAYEKTYVRFNKAASTYIYQEHVWLLTCSESLFQIQQLSLVGYKWKISSQYIASAEGHHRNTKLSVFIPKLMHVCYATNTEIKYSTVEPVDPNNDLKDIHAHCHTVLPLQQTIDGILDIQIDNKVYLLILYPKSYTILLWQQSQYKSLQHQPYKDQTTKKVSIEDETIQLEQIDGVIQVKAHEDEQRTRKMNILHCAKSTMHWQTKTGQLVTIGGNGIIIHKNK